MLFSVGSDLSTWDFNRVAMKQWKQHKYSLPFLTPFSLMCTEPVHIALQLCPRILPQGRNITLGRDRNGKNIIHQFNLPAGSIPDQSEQIKNTCQYVKCFKTVQEHSLQGVPVLWPAKHHHHIPRQIPAASACAPSQESILCFRPKKAEYGVWYCTPVRSL